MDNAISKRWAALVRAQALDPAERGPYLAAELDQLPPDDGPLTLDQVGPWLARLARDHHELGAVADAARELLAGHTFVTILASGERVRQVIEVDPDALERLTLALTLRELPRIQPVTPEQAELVAAVMGAAWVYTTDSTDPREQLVDQFKADLAVLGPDQVERIQRDVKARGGLRHLMIVDSEGADDGR